MENHILSKLLKNSTLSCFVTKKMGDYIDTCIVVKVNS